MATGAKRDSALKLTDLQYLSGEVRDSGRGPDVIVDPCWVPEENEVVLRDPPSSVASKVSPARWPVEGEWCRPGACVKARCQRDNPAPPCSNVDGHKESSSRLKK
ncbi:hypothetical protein NDU88_003459 [Pleurodeles waltl]|uniref:Uncharacterized protein n=1 Tax=Pleurodeles waltl TaxID=8319 RepID=A0AAV7UYI9_PLEWA|nr:hypothetical protein NDU88_003459 [Pleurodeles waltl]